MARKVTPCSTLFCRLQQKGSGVLKRIEYFPRAINISQFVAVFFSTLLIQNLSFTALSLPPPFFFSFDLHQLESFTALVRFVRQFRRY